MKKNASTTLNKSKHPYAFGGTINEYSYYSQQDTNVSVSKCIDVYVCVCVCRCI